MIFLVSRVNKIVIFKTVKNMIVFSIYLKKMKLYSDKTKVV